MIKNIVIAVLTLATTFTLLFALAQREEAGSLREEAEQIQIDSRARLQACLMEAEQQRIIAEHTRALLQNARDTIQYQHQLMVRSSYKH